MPPLNEVHELSKPRAPMKVYLDGKGKMKDKQRCCMSPKDLGTFLKNRGKTPA